MTTHLIKHGKLGLVIEQTGHTEALLLAETQHISPVGTSAPATLAIHQIRQLHGSQQLLQPAYKYCLMILRGTTNDNRMSIAKRFVDSRVDFHLVRVRDLIGQRTNWIVGLLRDQEQQGSGSTLGRL